MDERLYGAAIEGDVRILNQLFQEDPLILDKSILKCSDKNPLHIAAMFGHVDFVRTILCVNSDMCLSLDRNGRNPLHLAAIKGKREVLELLVQSWPLAAMEKTDDGGTIMHLCVKYRRLEMLKLLLLVHENFKDSEFLNSKNNEGMTALHMAVLDKQFEVCSKILSSL